MLRTVAGWDALAPLAAVPQTFGCGSYFTSTGLAGSPAVKVVRAQDGRKFRDARTFRLNRGSRGPATPTLAASPATEGEE